MDYAVFRVICPVEYKDIFVAELGEMGFDMMEETEDGIEAFVLDSQKSSITTHLLLDKYKHVNGILGEWDLVKTVNWNEEWEKNYDPIVVDGLCYIRAPFHPAEKEFPYSITIDPRMSFGTGHHATTYLMVSAILSQSMQGKKALDAGCGTGVLAILCEKKGAEMVDAFDISDWCVSNTKDNIALNQCSKIQVQTGTIEEITLATEYNFIFANINKNALVNSLSELSGRLTDEGTLFLSGFFVQDQQELIEAGRILGMKKVYEQDRSGWSVLGLQHSK